MAFFSFFPQLVAGPIERASHLLPQIQNKRFFNYSYAKSGLHLLVWGLLKKIVIADSCAIYVNEIFSNYQTLNSTTLILGSVYFAFQIYGDFSGYSDMAIGIARLFGFDMMRNFNYPYFSRNMVEFWRRWHISLSTWFRDYVYIPIGGSKVSKIIQFRNVFVVFLLSGLWHGANWTFIFLGLINAICFIPLSLGYKYNVNLFNINSSIKAGLQMLQTFSLVCFLWIFFRADNNNMAFTYIKRVFDFSLGIEYLGNEHYSVELLILILAFVLVEWFSKLKEEPISGKNEFIKIILCILIIFIFGNYSNPQDFIYFQF